MNQKLFRVVIALTLSMLFTGFAFAKSSYYPTDITVNNYSSYPCTVDVPAIGVISRYIPAYRIGNHFYSMDYSYTKRLVIWDYRNVVIFNAEVYNHGVVNVTNALVNAYQLKQAVQNIA